MAPSDTKAILLEIDELFERLDLVWDEPPTSDEVDVYASSYVMGAFTSWTAAIERFASPGSAYVAQAHAIRKLPGRVGHKILQLHGVLSALRSDYEAGYLRSVEELIHADVFGDSLSASRSVIFPRASGTSAAFAGLGGTLSAERGPTPGQGRTVAATSAGAVELSSVTASVLASRPAMRPAPRA